MKIIYQKDTYKHVKANQKQILKFKISYMKKRAQIYKTNISVVIALVHKKESDPIRTLNFYKNNSSIIVQIV